MPVSLYRFLPCQAEMPLAPAGDPHENDCICRPVCFSQLVFIPVAAKLLAGNRQVVASLHPPAVTNDTSEFCQKGRESGRFTFQLLMTMISPCWDIIRAGADFVVRMDAPDEFSFGVRHGDGIICTKPDLGRSFPAVASSLRPAFADMAYHDFEDSLQDVAQTVLQKLTGDKTFFIARAHSFFKTAIRNRSIDHSRRRRRGPSIATLEHDVAAPQPAISPVELEELRSSVFAGARNPEVLEMLGALEPTDLDDLSTLQWRCLRDCLTPRAYRTLLALTQCTNDQNAAADDLGVTRHAVRRMVFRIQQKIAAEQLKAA